MVIWLLLASLYLYVRIELKELRTIQFSILFFLALNCTNKIINKARKQGKKKIYNYDSKLHLDTHIFIIHTIVFFLQNNFFNVYSNYTCNVRKE